jgi:glutathione peroxidase
MEIHMSEALYDIPVKTIDGRDTSLDTWRGKVLLVVNVASKCGLTPQYEGLEKLYEDKRAEGVVVLGFNNFRGQEPGTNGEIAQFCTTKFGVGFPMFEKISVRGADQHPLYRRMIAARPHATAKPGSDFKAKLAGYGVKQDDERDVLWNFEKFLIARDGEVVARFAPDVEPQDQVLRQAVEQELAQS